MKKQSTRPLLVGIVERWRALEQAAWRQVLLVEAVHKESQVPAYPITVVLQVKAEHQTAHRELTHAETLLWLADQQWDREERAAVLLEAHNACNPTGRENAETLVPAPPIPTAKKS